MLKPVVIDISHWDASQRSVLVRYTREETYFAIIIGTKVVLGLDGAIRATLSVFSEDHTYPYKKRNCLEGAEVDQFQWVGEEPKDISDAKDAQHNSVDKEREAAIKREKEKIKNEVLKDAETSDTAGKAGGVSNSRAGRDAFDDDPVPATSGGHTRQVATKPAQLRGKPTGKN